MFAISRPEAARCVLAASSSLVFVDNIEMMSLALERTDRGGDIMTVSHTLDQTDSWLVSILLSVDVELLIIDQTPEISTEILIV